jgi:antitoxin VapB
MGETMEIAKVFWSGRSQAVRLPKAFRIDGESVRIRRHGSAIILEPCPKDWQWLRDLVGPVDEDFAAAATHQPKPQVRDSFDDLA